MQIQASREKEVMLDTFQKVKYCLYARKSTEGDEKQALSIDSQTKEMLQLAKKDDLHVVEIRNESHSAKDVGQRPVFNQIIQDIRSGIFTGILTWAPDRLSRNAGDLGSLVDLMDQNLLHEIRTYGQKFENSPNEKFLLMILCSQAKLENDNKSVNVKRGLRAKCEQGWRPSPPPLGYIHDKYSNKGAKKIFIDPGRAPYIKKMFEKVTEEQWSGRKILRWLHEKTNFKTRTGKNITLSMIYKILEETFYYGDFEYPIGSDKWYKGAHDPIITKDLFQKARDQLTRDNIQRSESKEFAFTKLMKCGLCGSGVTAEEKFKKIMDGSVRRYVYYGCTRGKNINCNGGYLREEELIKQICEMIDKISLDGFGIKENLEKEIERYNKFKYGVLGMSKKEVEKTKEVDMKNYAKYILKEGSILEKRELLFNMKTKLTMKNKKLLLAAA